MDSRIDDRPVIDRERRVLQALCTAGRNGLESAARLLTGYRWRDPVHQIIFACLCSSSAASPLSLREQLATCTTRKGFPEVDWDEFFPPNPISGHDAEELVRQLFDLDNERSQGR